MKPFLYFPARLLVIFTFSVVAACSSTKLVESWSEPEFTDKPFKKILILAVMQDDLQRRSFEGKFAERITLDGVEGVPGNTLMSNPEDYDEKSEIRQAVMQSGADAVLIATLVKVKKEERYVPPRVDYIPSYGYGHGMYDYWGRSYQSVYSPGYTTVDTIVKLETSVFSVDTENMVWSGRTESFNPKSSEKVVQENADVIAADMKKAGLI